VTDLTNEMGLFFFRLGKVLLHFYLRLDVLFQLWMDLVFALLSLLENVEEEVLRFDHEARGEFLKVVVLVHFSIQLDEFGTENLHV